MKYIMKHLKLIIPAILILLGSCTKDSGDYTAVLDAKEFTGNTYEYLQNTPGFDSLLFVIDRLSLTDTLKTNAVTLFAPKNESFAQVVSKYNLARKIRNKAPVYLRDMDIALLDSMICRYVIRGLYPANSFTQSDGLNVFAVRYGFPMNAKLTTADASGLKKGGPALLDFFYTKRSRFKSDWIRATVNIVDVKTSNGIIHTIETTHPFGFGEYTKPLPEPFENSKFRGGATGPFEFPSVVGTSILIEAEDFDEGGQGISYFDDASFNGNNYRIGGPDIDAIDRPGQPAATDAAGSYPPSHSIGWTKAGEWLTYTVNVPVAGGYKIKSRVSSAGAPAVLSFSFDFDLKQTTGTLSFPKNGQWWGWLIVESPVIQLSAGKHTMRFLHLTQDVQLNNFVITREN